jgi:hypothetical protein
VKFVLSLFIKRRHHVFLPRSGEFTGGQKCKMLSTDRMLFYTLFTALIFSSEIDGSAIQRENTLLQISPWCFSSILGIEGAKAH